MTPTTLFGKCELATRFSTTLPTANFPSYGSPPASHSISAANSSKSPACVCTLEPSAPSASCALISLILAASSFAFCASNCASYAFCFSISASYSAERFCVSPISCSDLLMFSFVDAISVFICSFFSFVFCSNACRLFSSSSNLALSEAIFAHICSYSSNFSLS